MSNGVYFILHGNIHIMDPSGRFKYATLTEDSCFGEISLLSEQPNTFAYFYDPNDKPVSLLCIGKDQFLDICAQNKGDATYMRKIA